MEDNEQGDLFSESSADGERQKTFSDADMVALAGLYSDEGVDFCALPDESSRLYELSVNAFSAIVHARMSELPISAKIERFERKVLGAADSAGRLANAAAATARGRTEALMRRAAELAAEDRGDPDACAVYEAAHKVSHEICRIRGFLRFAPGEDGVYTALCAPDHFILPALGEYFKKRFGGAPWEIIDEKRLVRIRYVPEKPFVFSRMKEIPEAIKKSRDSKWENVWRQYHKTISNADRSNPELQKKFMPHRYWKYLTEMQPASSGESADCDA